MSSRQAGNLAGWKSLYRQLPVFRRFAYPVRAEATMHVWPGRKSSGCLVGKAADTDEETGTRSLRDEHLDYC